MNKEYHRIYNLERCHKLRAGYIKYMGGQCKCGSTVALQFDHIDPKTKMFDVGSRISYPREIVLNELKKCQLLCKSCHVEKSILDSGKKKAKGTHGTLSSVRYCKCDLCRKAKRDYMIKWKHRRASQPAPS